MTRNRDLHKSLNILIFTLICALTLAYLQVNRLTQLNKTPSEKAKLQDKQALLYADQQQQSSLEFLKRIPQFGFENLIADWSFLSFLQYFGDDPARKIIGYTLVPQFFKVIVLKDPQFIYAYHYLSPTVTMFAGDPKTSVALVQEGLNKMTPQTQQEAFYLWRNKGTDEFLFLGDAQLAQQSFIKASEWAHQSSLPEASTVAERSLRTAKFIAKNPTSKKAKASAWMNIFASAVDNGTKNRAIFEFQKLGGKITQNKNKSWKISLPKSD